MAEKRHKSHKNKSPLQKLFFLNRQRRPRKTSAFLDTLSFFAAISFLLFHSPFETEVRKVEKNWKKPALTQ
jgi:hypothetical protein